MKLASKLQLMIEKFNGITGLISAIGDLKLNGAERIYTINNNRNAATKGLLIFGNNKKARIFEIDMRMYITSSFGFNKEICVVNHMGANIDIDYFYKNIQEQIKVSVARYVNLDPRRQEQILKKLGTCKTSNDTNWISYEEAFNKMLKAGFTRGNLKTIKEFENIAQEDVQGVEKVENFNVFGFSKDNNRLKLVLKEAVSYLKKHGFNHLNYGNFYLLPKRNKTVNADYTPSDDEIRAFEETMSTNSLDPVRTCLHELGHREFYKFISDASRRLVEAKYYASLRAYTESVSDKRKNLKIGDRFKIEGNDVEYGGYNPKGKKDVYRFYILDAKGVKTTRYYYYATLEKAFLSIKHAEKTENTANYEPYMPRAYSQTNASEWFADVFSFALLNDNKEVIEWLKSLK